MRFLKFREDKIGNAAYFLLITAWGQADIDLLVVAHCFDVSFKFFAFSQGLEDFVTIEQSGMGIVDDDSIT